jgi:hypothetical protein
MNEPSFGEKARESASPSDLLLLESSSGRDVRFSAMDAVVSEVAVRAARGERVVHLDRTERGARIEIAGVSDEVRATIGERFELAGQQAKGAWFLPEAVSIKADTVLFPAIFREAPRYAHTLAMDEKGKCSLAENGAAMLVWSVLQPFFDLLLSPIVLRVQDAGLLSRQEFLARWTDATGSFSSLGLSLDAELAPFAWGGGWARFGIDEQLAAKNSLLTAIANQMSGDVVRRFRAIVTRALIGQYYAKAKRGPAKRKQVITKEHAKGLAAFFGGDWLGFIDYLGEEPHDEERIVTALPEAKVMVSGNSKAAELAGKRGVPLEEVERILSAYWNDSGGNSPVLERVGVFARYWQCFDEIHARQTPALPPLWGLVEDGGAGNLEPDAGNPYQPELYRRLLPSDLLRTIERLWGTTVLVKWPDCVVSEPFPHSLMAETFGPALRFWHGCALTAWFICEGPMSRTDIARLAKYYGRELVALEDLGVPIQPQLFQELNAVQLGPEEPIYSNNDHLPVGYGVSLSVRMSSGSRRRGFELLRDVITRHRRTWASLYLDAYLRALWETELKAAARQFHLMTEEKGKSPTLKQFAKYAVEPAQHWFGGDVGLLYASLGQKLSGDGIRRSLRMPENRLAFASSVFRELGGVPFERKVMVENREEGRRQAEAQDRHHKLKRLAGESLRYLQLWEALGRPPVLSEFGSGFEWLSQVLAGDESAAWNAYAAAIERVAARQTS